MKIRRRFTEDSYRREPWFRSLCDALLSCKTEDELANMLRDIATLGELQAWGERLEVAKQLARGLSYRDVAATTGASTTTVTRVARFIENGAGGYRRYLNVHRHHRLGVQMVPRKEGGAERTANADAPQQPTEQISSLPESPDVHHEPKNVSVLQKYLDRK